VLATAALETAALATGRWPVHSADMMRNDDTPPTPVDSPRPAGPAGPVVRAVPPGEDRERLLCRDCGYIAYENPKIVVGSVAVWTDGRILLCRRAIEPRLGYWTLPAGYMELNETTEQAAMREAREEACADIEPELLLAVYNIPRISQVQLIYRARLRSDAIAVGPESLEVGLFAWDDIPWRRLAFPTVVWALEAHRLHLGQTGFPPAVNPVPAP
jgi:ADP-ribose pyrophosphatase YjhB (NUDIX family)